MATSNKLTMRIPIDFYNMAKCTIETKYYTAKLSREGDRVLVEFPSCPGCQTLVDPGENPREVALRALKGWLDAQAGTGEFMTVTGVTRGPR